MIAHWHGQIWNASEIGRSLGEAHVTVKRHLDALTGALMVRPLQPWFENLGKRQVKAPKVYVHDAGLLHALLDLLLLLRGRRIGVEVKYADAPSMTRSMHVSIESLKLDRLHVVYPGTEPYALRPGVEVLPLPLARERLAAARAPRTALRPRKRNENR